MRRGRRICAFDLFEFDFNKDGKLDGFERAMEFMFIEEMVKDDSGDEDEFAEDNDY